MSDARARVFLALLGVAATLVVVVWSQRVASAADLTVTHCTNAGVQAAIASASPGDRLRFNCASPQIAITTTVAITKSLTLDGANLHPSGPIIFDGGGVTRVISLSSGVAMTLTNVTVQRGNGDVDVAGVRFGGGVWGDGSTSVTLVNAHILSNTALSGGGVAAGRVTVIGGSVVSNTAGMAGGGLNVTAATLSGTVIARNQTFIGAGGGGLNSLTATITNSDFLSNVTSTSGGGAQIVTGTVTGSRFHNNGAAAGGGLWGAGPIVVSATAFISNRALGNGGGIWTNGAITLTGGAIVSNTARDGGGLRAGAAVTLIDVTLTSNAAITSGGAISLAANTPVALTFLTVTLRDNRALDATIAAAVPQTATGQGVLLAPGASGASCRQVRFPSVISFVAPDASCGQLLRLPVGFRNQPLGQ